VDLFSPNPVRILFRHYFLIKIGDPYQARFNLDMALMDHKQNIMLLELRAACSHMLDDLADLRETNLAITRAYQAQGIDLDARCQALFATLLEDSSDLDLILELIRLLSYGHRYDHCTNTIREAEKIHTEASDLYLLAARIHRLDNKPEASMRALKKALELDPSNFMAEKALQSLKRHLAAGDKTPAGKEGS
jgi:hypothetical protein